MYGLVNDIHVNKKKKTNQGLTNLPQESGIAKMVKIGELR